MKGGKKKKKKKGSSSFLGLHSRESKFLASSLVLYIVLLLLLSLGSWDLKRESHMSNESIMAGGVLQLFINSCSCSCSCFYFFFYSLFWFGFSICPPSRIFLVRDGSLHMDGNIHILAFLCLFWKNNNSYWSAVCLNPQRHKNFDVVC
ncbi:hypothetical protein BGZ63DRAFT_239280 [Mariannaea sp. PMI_226]|nr:hypothetical protein BGZ63DRAFT_239280 [Mariannaea sp. PMI_226]